MSENTESESLNCGNGARVLIVDDSRVNRLILKTRLSQAGYEVTEAHGGEEALSLLCLPGEGGSSLDPDTIDAVVLDIMMPDIDGLQVLQRIRENYTANELPVIMATSKDQSKDIVGALEQGSNDYVTKPIDIPVLLARLRTQVSLKRTHLALKQAQHSLIEAAKMESVGYLAAGVAHEVRNPLATIQMGIEAIGLSDAVQQDKELLPMMEIVTRAVEKADSIVRELMKVSTTGQLELTQGSINKLLGEAVQSIASAAEKAGVTIDTDFDDSLSEPAFAEIELMQVISSLLQNAIDAMPGGGSLSVDTRNTQLNNTLVDDGTRSGRGLRNGDQVVEIVITDSGSGIHGGDLQKVFDPFFTTRPTGQGTGLGLSVAKKVVDLHGGAISIVNRQDKQGTQVTIHLPFSEPPRQMV